MRPQNIPEREILFAARTGFLSKPIWEAYFAHGSDRWKRRQWQLLCERGHFEAHPSRFARNVVIPNRANAEVRKLVPGGIVSPPYGPQIEHDEMVVRTVLFLRRKGLASSFKLEAELKREDWQKGLLKEGEQKKFPDVILDVQEAGRTIRLAVEIELSRKSPRRYRQIFESYAARKDVQCVVFAARSRAVFDGLKAAMLEAHYPNGECPIGFVELDAWMTDPSRAVMFFAGRKVSLEEMRNLR